MDKLTNSMLDKIEEEVELYYVEEAKDKELRFAVLLEELPGLMNNFGRKLDDIDTIETIKYSFNSWKSFCNNKDADVFGGDIFILMKDRSFVILKYIDKIDMYASNIFRNEEEYVN